MKAVIRIIRVVIAVVLILCFLDMNRYAINPKNTTAIVAWPLGIENVDSWIRAFRGLALWMIAFRSLIRIAVMIITYAKIVACLFFFFE